MDDEPEHRRMRVERSAAHAPGHGRRFRPNRLGLDVLVGGVMSGLLALAGAALIDPDPPAVLGPTIVPGSASAPAVAGGCASFEIGSPRPATTRIQLDNAGPERVHVRLDFVDQDGSYANSLGHSPILGPSEAREFVFRSPAYGATVKLFTSGASLQVGVEVHHEDEAPPEIRTQIPCLPDSPVPPRATIISAR